MKETLTLFSIRFIVAGSILILFFFLIQKLLPSLSRTPQKLAHVSFPFFLSILLRVLREDPRRDSIRSDTSAFM